MSTGLMFWSTSVAQGKPTDTKLASSPDEQEMLHVTHVALGDDAGAGRHVVHLTTQGQKVVIGTLERGRCEQFNCDLCLDDDVIWGHSGSGTVYLTGYKTQSYLDDDDSEDEDYEEDEEEEEAAPKLVSYRPPREAAANGTAAKLAKAVDEEEDEDDEDFDANKGQADDDEDEDDDEDDEDMVFDEADLADVDIIGALKDHMRAKGMPVADTEDEEDDNDEDPEEDDDEDVGANENSRRVANAADDDDDEDMDDDDDEDDDEDDEDDAAVQDLRELLIKRMHDKNALANGILADDDDDDEDDDEFDDDDEEEQPAPKPAPKAKSAARTPASKDSRPTSKTPASSKKRAAETPEQTKSAKKSKTGGKSEDDQKYKDALVKHLKVNGATQLSHLGSAVKRPAGVAAKLSQFVHQFPKVFKVDSQGQMVMLVQ